jgi:Peptidase A4 family
MKLRMFGAVAAVTAVAMLLSGAASAATRSVPTIRNHTGWSGYTTYISTVNGKPTSTEYYADATWTVPKIDCNPIHHPILGESSVVGEWIGLGGVSAQKDPAAGHLVQAGIRAYCDEYLAHYDTVYQILPPDKTVVFLGAKYPVKPGNTLEVTVERHSKHVYSMEINNVTRQWVWSHTFKVSFGNVPDSADYIVESPDGTSQADFGKVTFRTSNYTTFPLGTCPTCGPSFLNLGYAFRFIGLTASNQALTKVGQITSPVSDDPGTFSVEWVRGS